MSCSSAPYISNYDHKYNRTIVITHNYYYGMLTFFLLSTVQCSVYGEVLKTFLMIFLLYST